MKQQCTMKKYLLFSITIIFLAQLGVAQENAKHDYSRIIPPAPEAAAGFVPEGWIH